MATDSETSELLIDTRPLGGAVAQLSVSGTLDWSNYHKVDAELQRLFTEKTYRIVVNLAGVKMISSAGFGCFIGALDTSLKNNGNIIFVRIPDEIQDIFGILGLSRILTFAATEDEALRLLGPKPAP